MSSDSMLTRCVFHPRLDRSSFGWIGSGSSYPLNWWAQCMFENLINHSVLVEPASSRGLPITMLSSSRIQPSMLTGLEDPVFTAFGPDLWQNGFHATAGTWNFLVCISKWQQQTQLQPDYVSLVCRCCPEVSLSWRASLRCTLRRTEFGKECLHFSKNLSATRCNRWIIWMNVQWCQQFMLWPSMLCMTQN